VKGVLAGGLLSGLLGVFMGLIPVVQYFCCIVALIGGAAAGLVHVKTSKEGVGMGQGAVTGVISGLVMFLMLLFINVPLGLLVTFVIAGVQPEFFLDYIRYSWPQMIIGYAIQFTLALIYCFGFSAVGAVAATAMFEDRSPGSTEKKDKPSGPVAMPQAGQPLQQMPPGQQPPTGLPPSY
jgi:hypothetical protein